MNADKILSVILPLAISGTLLGLFGFFSSCSVKEKETFAKRQAETQQTMRAVCGADTNLNSDAARALVCAELARR